MLRSFFSAFSMLTAIPFPKTFSPSEKEVRGSSDFFPFVGLFLGAVDFFIAMFLIRFLPPLPAAVLMTVIPEMETRGFHFDGLADTGDGFLSSRSRDRILEIMHDSRTGSMGVLVSVSYLLLKISFLASLPQALFPAACGFAALAGRVALTFALCMGSYARKEGLGKIFFERRPLLGVLLGLGLAATADLFLTGICFHILPVVIFVPFWYCFCRSKIGGHTGDTLGACLELSTLVSIASFLLIR